MTTQRTPSGQEAMVTTDLLTTKLTATVVAVNDTTVRCVWECTDEQYDKAIAETMYDPIANGLTGATLDLAQNALLDREGDNPGPRLQVGQQVEVTVRMLTTTAPVERFVDDDGDGQPDRREVVSP